MSLFAGSSRESLRQAYREAWRKHRERLPLQPLEAQIADVIALHPEYHPLLENEAALQHDYTPEGGETNPFLHMGLHLALREQLSTDRPVGVRELYQRLAARIGEHEAQHRMIDSLAQTLWEAQRRGQPPDEQRYLESLRRL